MKSSLIIIAFILISSSVFAGFSSQDKYNCIIEKVQTACPNGVVYYDCQLSGDTNISCSKFTLDLGNTNISQVLSDFEDSFGNTFLVGGKIALFCRETNNNPHLLYMKNMQYYWEDREMFCPGEKVEIDASSGGQVSYKSPGAIQAKDNATVILGDQIDKLGAKIEGQGTAISNLDSNLAGVSQKLERIENQSNNTFNINFIGAALIGSLISLSLFELGFRFIWPKIKQKFTKNEQKTTITIRK